MSKKVIHKEIEATVCDYCNLEVDTEGDEYCYANVRAMGLEARKPSRTIDIKHFVFKWLRKPSDAEIWANPKARPQWIRYDFHAECLDAAIKQIIADKVTVS